jgi:hypothetical protein
MGDESLVSKLLKETLGKSSSRYVYRKGKRIKFEEYQILDAQDKEVLEMREELDFTKIDAELERLNEEYRKQKDSKQRQILAIKYDLVLENFVHDNPNYIIQLKQQLKELEETD